MKGTATPKWRADTLTLSARVHQTKRLVEVGKHLKQQRYVQSAGCSSRQSCSIHISSVYVAEHVSEWNSSVQGVLSVEGLWYGFDGGYGYGTDGKFQEKIGGSPFWASQLCHWTHIACRLRQWPCQQPWRPFQPHDTHFALHSPNRNSPSWVCSHRIQMMDVKEMSLLSECDSIWSRDGLIKPCSVISAPFYCTARAIARKGPNHIQ